MNKIGNCPICDSASMKILINGRDGIGCTECGLMYRPESADETWEETVKHWNTRKPIEKILLQLEEEISDYTITEDDGPFTLGIESFYKGIVKGLCVAKRKVEGIIKERTGTENV